MGGRTVGQTLLRFFLLSRVHLDKLTVRTLARDC
jgi:hypothetical protein